jgi:hypothetical protein
LAGILYYQPPVSGVCHEKNFRSLLVFGVVLAAAMVCGAAPLDANHAIVASQGVTSVTAAFGKTEVVVKITTHEVDIGRPSDEWPQKRLSSCTYS